MLSTRPRLLLALAASSLASAAGLSCKKGGDDAAPSASAAPSSAAPAPRPSASVAEKATPPSTPSAAPASAGGGEGDGCGMDGSWRAVAYACKGEAKKPFPAFLSWTFGMNRADASFKEQLSPPLPACTGIQPWKASCSKSPAVITLTSNDPEQCTPSNCLRAPRGKPSGGCGKVPGAPLVWTITERTPSSMVFTSVEPFNLTTCTSSGKSNPLTVWWQKQ